MKGFLLYIKNVSCGRARSTFHIIAKLDVLVIYRQVSAGVWVNKGNSPKNVGI